MCPEQTKCIEGQRVFSFKTDCNLICYAIWLFSKISWYKIPRMKNERATVIIDGATFSIPRQELASNLQMWNRVARYHNKRPGERTGELYPPNNRFSFDKLGTMSAVLHSDKANRIK